MKIIAKCPDCGTIYKGIVEYDKLVLPDEYHEIVTLSEPCPACVKADGYAKEMLGDLYVSIEERKK